MTTETQPQPSIAARKDDHLAIAARRDALDEHGSGLRDWRIARRVLPGRDLAAVDLTTSFLGATLAAPVLVSAMTGGSERAATVSARLAAAAVEHGLRMALGSGRALLADPTLRSTYVPGPRPPLDDRAGQAMGVGVEQLRIATWAAGVATPAALVVEHLQPG